MNEIRFSGFGGQGIIRQGLILGKALSLYDNKFATMTQSFGPEARGSACSSQLVVSEERVLYPYVTKPEVLVAMSQEAYEKYEPELREGGTLIIDSDLVRLRSSKRNIKIYCIPSTRFAEEIGNRIYANLVMLGFFAAVTKIVTPEAIKKALPGLVPSRYLETNIKAFDRGYNYGLEVLEKETQPSTEEKAAARKAPKTKSKGTKK
jgi:2-oxoglutarate ferredoxin oxidoreductase subunit gamma